MMSSCRGVTVGRCYLNTFARQFGSRVQWSANTQDPVFKAAAIAEKFEKEYGPTNPSIFDEEEPINMRADRPTGQIHQLPTIHPPEDTLRGATRRTLVRTVPVGKLYGRIKAVNLTIRQLDEINRDLGGTLGGYVDAFPPFEYLHPFEQQLVRFVCGDNAYTRLVTKVANLKKAVAEVCRAYASKAGKAQSIMQAEAIGEEALQTLVKVYERGHKTLRDLGRITQILRKMPFIDHLIPTLALVGAPNVGKSSIVRLLSSGTPEVCNYPFTTRKIIMGHFYLDGKKYQITDTPGLLSRADEQRNDMELLTLSVLEHLPTMVVFVADLTEECGTTVQDQWLIRQELKRKFGHKLWLDIFSKSDLLEDEFQQADKLIGEADNNGKNYDEDVEQIEDGEADNNGNNYDEDVEQIEDAVEFAARLQNARRMSSLSEEGVPDLKQNVMDMTKKEDMVKLFNQHLEQIEIELNDQDLEEVVFNNRM